ncbi:hypothetical protein D3C76_1857860 [compost metagenome]
MSKVVMGWSTPGVSTRRLWGLRSLKSANIVLNVITGGDMWNSIRVKLLQYITSAWKKSRSGSSVRRRIA